jgi:hypothetical protein
MAMSSNSDRLDPIEYKLLGDSAFRSNNIEKAVLYYTKAIASLITESTDGITNNNSKALLYSNRSAAHLKAGNPYGALEDATSCIKVDPTFAKGYSRKGSALHSLKRYPESINAYKEGLELFPDNEALKNGLASVLLESEELSGEAQNGEQKPFQPTSGLFGFGKNAFEGLRSSVVSAGNIVKSGVNNVGNTAMSGINKASAQFKSIDTITIDLELKIYSQGEKIKGKIILNLAEPLQADHLSVTLAVKRKRNLSKDDDTVETLLFGAPEDLIFSEAYEISGKKVYMPKQEIPFELIIPYAISKSNGNTGAILQALGDMLMDRDVSIPPMWSYYATLGNPGGRLLPIHSSEYRLHVND